uniref:Uncharacterized protein n=1 Tax=Vespula pensylvanica TaxID=30213 RepID=A0A834JTA5_VESPE|nr:hypothetical protein H0235_017033 [Vespula pensylvanica]
MDLKPENLLFREEADRSDERDETGVHALADDRKPVASNPVTPFQSGSVSATASPNLSILTIGLSRHLE